jgi:protocatechuate 3,4-dioxygenase beta subunit
MNRAHVHVRIPILLVSLLALPSSAQVSSIAANPSTLATIEGIVVKDPGSEPVKKAVIELIAENQSAGGNYTAVTNADGIFHIEGIGPGRYHLFAERTGYVEGAQHGSRGQGRILTLAVGQTLKDIQIRLAAAATVTGRVTDEDGDSLENAEVSVLRRTFAAGRARWQQIRSERTNDLGEYRIPNLPAGNYYVSVNPPPDFKALLDSENSPVSGKPANNTEKPSTSYQTTYYPGTADRGQAEPIQLHAGDEFPANFSLAPSPTLTIRGSVANLPPRASATILLQANDFNVVFNGAEVHKDGSFVIYDVAPGAYTIVASVDDAPAPMIARQSLQITSNNIDGLRLVPQAGATIRGKLHLEGKNVGPRDTRPMTLVLQPSEGPSDGDLQFSTGIDFSPAAPIASDGSFQWTNVPPGNYSLRLGTERNFTSDWFLKSATVGGRTNDLSAISVDGGVIALDVTAGANGAVVEGIVTDLQGQPVADAVVVAAPEASQRLHGDHLHKTASDQNGRFTLRGIAPGQYSLFAWDNVEGEAYYDPEFLKNYDPQATSLGVSEGDRRNVQLHVIPTSEDSQ